MTGADDDEEEVVVEFSVLFDRMVDHLGAEQAAEVMRDLITYKAGHADCDLPGGVRISDTGTDLNIQLIHSADCPTLALVESYIEGAAL